MSSSSKWIPNFLSESSHLQKSPTKMSGKVSGRSDSLTTASSCLPDTHGTFPPNDFGPSDNGIDEDRFRLFESLCLAQNIPKVHNLKDIPLPTIGNYLTFMVLSMNNQYQMFFSMRK